MSHFFYWTRFFTDSFVPQVQAFSETLTRRVLPGFDTVNAEGRRIEQEAYRELSRGAGEDFDAADAAEEARDQAITYWVTMYGIQQGVVNLFGLGLWHLFEQQVTHFIRHAIREPWDPAPSKPPLEILQEELQRMGVDIEIRAMASYAKVDELRLVANCAKHGDGDSCAKLRIKRPDLFTPTPHIPSSDWPTPGRVIAPLGGEDLYTPEGFQEYARAVVAFWEQLARRILDSIAR